MESPCGRILWAKKGEEQHCINCMLLNVFDRFEWNGIWILKATWSHNIVWHVLTSFNETPSKVFHSDIQNFELLNGKLVSISFDYWVGNFHVGVKILKRTFYRMGISEISITLSAGRDVKDVDKGGRGKEIWLWRFAMRKAVARSGLLEMCFATWNCFICISNWGWRG